VRWDTEILNGKNGEDVDLNRLHVGDELTAYYSSISTRSLPPQSRAYALVMGDGQHDGIYMHVSKVDKVKNGVKFLNTNEDMFVTIPENVEDDAKELKQGDKVLVWYDFVAMSMPGQATATKAVILD
jgi:cold shock CspA family protein